MIFHEIYGNYYHTVAEILDAALKEEISDKTIWKIVKEKAFAESSDDSEGFTEKGNGRF